MKRKKLIVGFCAKCQEDKELHTHMDGNGDMICECPDCLGFVKIPTENRARALKLLEKEKLLNKRYDILTRN